MYKITLEIANNGVVKTTIDDNANGGGETEVEKTVHQLEGDESRDFAATTEFLFNLCEDLGLDLGSAHTRKQLQFISDYGENYTLTEDELKELQRHHKYEMVWIRKALELIKSSKPKK